MSKTQSQELLNPPTFEQRLADTLRSSYSLPFRGDVWDYLEKHCRFPHSVRTTRVSRATSPWIVAPVRSIFARRKREQTVVGPVQGSKTAIIDLLVQWIVAQAPGETWLNMQKKEAADAVAEKRFVPMLKKNPQTARLLPTDPHKIRKSEIVFDHMAFKVQGATENNLQSSSVPWVINDEVWLWENVGLLEQARKRITAVFNGCVVNCSQGSVEGDHLDQAFQSGGMNDWGWTCPHCHEWQPFSWYEEDGDHKQKPGGVRWDDKMRRDSGDYDLDRVLSSVHMGCRNRACLAQFRDTITERRGLADAGSYIAQNDNPEPDRESWRWNAMTVYWIEWRLLVAEWFKAQAAKRSGNVELLRLFKQQRLAQFWQNREQQALTSLRMSGYSWLDYTEGRAVENERCRFMTIDFQRRDLRVCIRAWKARGLGSMLLRYESVSTFDDARRLQLQYNIANDCTFLDLRFNNAEGSRQLTRWQTVNGKGMVLDWGWTGIMGEDRANGYPFTAGTGAKPVLRPFSTFNYSVTEEGKKYRYLLFSTLLIKDILHHHRTGGGNPWELPNDVPGTYKAEIDTEYRAVIEGKNGTGRVARWLPIRKNIANHAWDTEAHQITAACIVGLIDYGDAEMHVEAKPGEESEEFKQRVRELTTPPGGPVDEG